MRTQSWCLLFLVGCSNLAAKWCLYTKQRKRETATEAILPLWPFWLIPTFVLDGSETEWRQAVMPSPVRATRWGLLLALSLKLSTAVRVPEVFGSKRMVAVQLAQAASFEPQVFL